MTKADRRDAKRRAKREDRATGLAAFRYVREPSALAVAKTRNAVYKRAASRAVRSKR